MVKSMCRIQSENQCSLIGLRTQKDFPFGKPF